MISRNFSLFGYGGNAWDGDDHADERRFFYRVTADGGVHEVDALPPRLERGDNNAPVRSPPYLRWSVTRAFRQSSTSGMIGRAWKS
jgi:hypothetical protein